MMRLPLRRAFTLLPVLGFLSGVASLALVALLSARGIVATATNRASLMRAEWRAEACVARVRAVLSELERAAIRAARDRLEPREVVAAVREAPVVQDCPGVVTLEPSGSRVDVNNATPAFLARVLIGRGIPEATADSLVAALVDWRDADDDPEPLGAEAAWYVARGEAVPRNAPLVDLDELRLVRGFERWVDGGDSAPGLGDVLTTVRGGLSLELAPIELVTALAGMEMGMAAAILQARDMPSRGTSLASRIATIMREADYEQAMHVIRANADNVDDQPEYWLLRATASGVADHPTAARLTTTVELLLIPDGLRFTIARRMIDP